MPSAFSGTQNQPLEANCLVWILAWHHERKQATGSLLFLGYLWGKRSEGKYSSSKSHHLSSLNAYNKWRMKQENLISSRNSSEVVTLLEREIIFRWWRERSSLLCLFFFLPASHLRIFSLKSEEMNESMLPTEKTSMMMKKNSSHLVCV